MTTKIEIEPKNKVLIIDDSRLFLSFISQILKAEQYIEFKVINDPRLAIEEAIKFAPDLILSDLEMPHISGIELLRLLKNQGELQTIPIIMLSSSDSEKNLVLASENGAHDFLNKNLNPKLIIAKIAMHLKHKKVLDQESNMKQLALLIQLTVLANHEFNNALFISNAIVRKLKKTLVSEDEIRGLEKIEKMNLRMSGIVKKFENLKTIDIENFHKEIEFLEIDY